MCIGKTIVGNSLFDIFPALKGKALTTLGDPCHLVHLLTEQIQYVVRSARKPGDAH
jgi:hypothetical protein